MNDHAEMFSLQISIGARSRYGVLRVHFDIVIQLENEPMISKEMG